MELQTQSTAKAVKAAHFHNGLAIDGSNERTTSGDENYESVGANHKT